MRYYYITDSKVDENEFVIKNGVLKEYEGNKKEIVIPNGVEEIGDSVFDGYRSLQSVTIPGSVKKIGEDAFYSCGSLQSIIIPNGVEEIGAGIFAFCDSLQSVTISGSVKEIGEYAFKGCDSLKSIYINDEKTAYVILENNPRVKDKIVMFR